MNYYILENGQQAGPFNIEQLRYKGITGETDIWRKGMAQWGKAKDLPELSSILQVAPHSTNPPYGQPYGQSYGQPYGQQPYAPQPTYPQQLAQEYPNNHMTKAIISTIMSFFLCGGIGAIFGIIAIVSANKVVTCWRNGYYDEALRQAKDANTWANIGIILSIISFIIGIIWVMYLYFHILVGIIALDDASQYYVSRT